MGLQDTPRASRLHIGIYGRRNSGKSTLINALTGQRAALVSDIPGTTADPVYQAMEIPGIGPCVLIDTAGFDDRGQLGQLRVQATRQTLDKIDLAILVFAGDDIALESAWAWELEKRRVPVLLVLNRCDEREDSSALLARIEAETKQKPLPISAKDGWGIDAVREALCALLPEDYEPASIAGHLAGDGDTVLLVMPQDRAAPKGRLILAQVQTIRDLLDNRCLTLCVTPDRMEAALAALRQPPKLIITDSQAFPQVAALRPPESLLTSFSVLMAGYKGDVGVFIQGARAIDGLSISSRVLIAEACTHAPVSEDIGRVKIPALLRQRVGEGLQIDLVSGADFPEDLTGYDLVIHCGACMFNRRHVLSRIARAQAQEVPITNYGITLAKLSGILEQISY